MHVLEYVLIIAFLAMINVLTAPHRSYLGPVGRDSLGIGSCAARPAVFDKIPFLNEDWERRAVEKYLGRKL